MKTAIALLVLLVQLVSAAQARGPSTSEERQRVVTLARHLETDPLAKDAKDARAWLTLWLIEVPDITVTACLGLLGDGFDTDQDYAAELAVQQIYSAAAFKIQYPDQASDDLIVDTASVSGVLRAYAAIQAKHSNAKFPSLDILRDAERVGQLPGRLADASKKCHQ